MQWGIGWFPLRASRTRRRGFRCLVNELLWDTCRTAYHYTVVICGSRRRKKAKGEPIRKVRMESCSCPIKHFGMTLQSFLGLSFLNEPLFLQVNRPGWRVKWEKLVIFPVLLPEKFLYRKETECYTIYQKSFSLSYKVRWFFRNQEKCLFLFRSF